MPRARRPLRTKLIVSGLQYRLLAGSFLYLAAMSLIFLGAIFVPLVHTLDDEGASPLARDDAARQLLALNSRVWTAVPFVVFFCVIHSLLVSHRIAGPLYRFKQFVAILGRGDFSRPVVIRQNDYLHPEAKAINRMVEGVVGKIEPVRAGHVEACETLAELIRALESRSAEEPAVLAGKLGTQLDAIGHRLGQIRIPGEPAATALGANRSPRDSDPGPAGHSEPAVTELTS